MSSGNKNEKLEFARNMVAKKMNKYSHHLRELTIVKVNRLNEQLMEHLEFFNDNYVMKIYQSPLYFLGRRKILQNYLRNKIYETKDEFSKRSDVTKRKLRNLYHQYQWVFNHQYAILTIITAFILSKLTKKI